MILLKIGVLVSFSVMIAVNVLANTLPINNKTTGEISASYPTLFTPSGFTFSIWGIIYILLGAYVVFVLVTPSDALNPNVLVLFIVSALLNAVWLFAWHYDKQGLATLILLLLVVVLALIVMALKTQENWQFYAFSVYLGWVCVAFIANVSILLYKLNWSVFMNFEIQWFTVVLLLIGLLAAVMLFKEGNIVVVLVFLWALFGISIKHNAESFEASRLAFLLTSGMILLITLMSIAWIFDTLKGRVL